MSNFFRQHVLHNFGLKVIAVGLAVGLWLAISRDPVAEVAVTVPIEFHRIPENLEINSERIPEAQVRVRGPERLIHRLQSSDVHAEIDLGIAIPGERTFDLTARHIRQPNGLEVVQVVPSQFQISFDTRLVREIEVHPRVIGNFASGYRIASIQADPATISIAGPKKRVEATEAATTDPVDVTGTMGRGTFVTHAYVPDPLVQIVHPAPVHVTVIMEKAESGRQ
jgi:YbbR domain-containing protein